MSMSMCLYVSVYMCVCLCACVCVYACVCVCMRVCMCDHEHCAGDQFDVIITDYIGLQGLEQVGILPGHYCKVRVLDTFGSEPLG